MRGWERSDRLAQPNTARGGAAKQTVGAAPRINPGAKEPQAPASGPNVRVKRFGYFWASAKVTRRKGETLSSRYRSNGYSQNTPPAWSARRPPRPPRQKKGATEVAPKCLACPSIQKNHFLRLCASFQIKNPNPAKNRTISPTVRTPANTTLSKNMTGLLAPALLRWD